MEFKDYYAILGVSKDTPTEDIKRAYRKLARQYHPDVSKLPDAEHKFKEINEAWDVLQDPEKRARYDQIAAGGWHPEQAHQRQAGAAPGYDFQQAAGFAGEQEDFSEFFNSIFGNRGFAGAQRQQAHYQRKGRDLHARLPIPLKLAYEGGMHTLELQVPTYDQHRMIPHNKSLNVKIPAGVVEGSQIRLKGQGGEGSGGGPKGDLYIEIQIMPHPFFSLHHKDVQLTLPITPWEAALGATIAVPTLGGAVNLKIPAAAQSEQKLRLKDRGMPGHPPGDQYVILEIRIPEAKTDQDKALYQEMAQQMPFNPRERLGV